MDRITELLASLQSITPEGSKSCRASSMPSSTAWRANPSQSRQSPPSAKWSTAPSWQPLKSRGALRWPHRPPRQQRSFAAA